MKISLLFVTVTFILIIYVNADCSSTGVAAGTTPDFLNGVCMSIDEIMETNQTYFTNKFLEMSVVSALDIENNFEMYSDVAVVMINEIPNLFDAFFTFNIVTITEQITESTNKNIGKVNSAIVSATTGPIQYTYCGILQDKLFTCDTISTAEDGYIYCVNGFRAILNTVVDPDEQLDTFLQMMELASAIPEVATTIVG